MAQKAETRETITQVASGIFARYGFRKTTLDDIARACRKGKSSIYYYFRNKEDIFEAVLEKEIIVLKSQIFLALDETPDPKEKLKVYVLTRMNGMKSLVNVYNAMKNEYLSQFDFIERVREKYDNIELGILKSILDEGIAKGIFHIGESSVTAMALFTAMKGFEIPMFIKDHPDLNQALDNRLDMMLDILFYGLVKR